MTKTLRIIAIIMPFVVFILFFIPMLSVNLVSEFDDNLNSTDFIIINESAYVSASEHLNQQNIDWAALIISLFITALLISFCCAIVSVRKIITCFFNIVSLTYFWSLAIAEKQYLSDFTTSSSFHAAFYISLILSAFFLAVLIAYAVKWLKPRFANRPPREHKPTKSERIAELERRVAELTKEKDAE